MVLVEAKLCRAFNYTREDKDCGIRIIAYEDSAEISPSDLHVTRSEASDSAPGNSTLSMRGGAKVMT